MHYKVFPTAVRPMSLTCSSAKFVAEYRACWEDPDRNTQRLYKLAKPFINSWVHMLQTPGSKKDISFVTLCRMLEAQGKEPVSTISYWCQAVSSSSSVEEEITLLFFTRLRAMKFFPKQASAIMAEYVVAKDFRNALKDAIAKVYNNPIDLLKPGITSLLWVEDDLPDYLLLKNFERTLWEDYLLELFKSGYSAADIARFTHIPHRTVIREVSNLWNQLRTRWQQA